MLRIFKTYLHIDLTIQRQCETSELIRQRRVIFTYDKVQGVIQNILGNNLIPFLSINNIFYPSLLVKITDKIKIITTFT